MKDAFGKFTLSIVTSVSLSAIAVFISKTTPDNKKNIDNDTLYTPHYRGVVINNELIKHEPIKHEPIKHEPIKHEPINNEIPDHKKVTIKNNVAYDETMNNDIYKRCLIISNLDDMLINDNTYFKTKKHNNDMCYFKDKYDKFTEYFDI